MVAEEWYYSCRTLSVAALLDSVHVADFSCRGQMSFSPSCLRVSRLSGADYSGTFPVGFEKECMPRALEECRSIVVESKKSVEDARY